MIVSELIEILQTMPQSKEITIKDDCVNVCNEIRFVGCVNKDPFGPSVTQHKGIWDYYDYGPQDEKAIIIAI